MNKLVESTWIHVVSSCFVSITNMYRPSQGMLLQKAAFNEVALFSDAEERSICRGAPVPQWLLQRALLQTCGGTAVCALARFFHWCSVPIGRGWSDRNHLSLALIIRAGRFGDIYLERRFFRV